jgi:hypothetical protein
MEAHRSVAASVQHFIARTDGEKNDPVHFGHCPAASLAWIETSADSKK